MAPVPNPFQDGLSVQVQGDASDLESTIADAKAALGNLRKSVGAVGAALSGLALGALAKATSSAARFESQIADLEKAASADIAKEMRGEIMALSEEIPVARGELVTLAEQAAKFGAEGTAEISQFVETVGQIQTATSMSAEVAGKRFSKIAGAVGMPLDEIDKLGNATNRLADSMKTDADEITDTATRASNILSQQLGLGEDAVLALSASMNEVSPSSRKAAGALKRAAEAMLDPKKVSDIAAALGMTAGEFRKMREENPQKLMERIASAMAEGGTAATELRSAVGKRATRAFSKLGGQLEATETAQKRVNSQFEEGTSLEREMSIRTDTAAGKWQLFKNKIQNVATVTGQNLLPVAKDLLDRLNGLLGRLAALNERTNGLAGLLSALALAIGGATTAVIAFLPQIAAIASILSGSVIPVLGTFAAILTGPVGLAIAGVAAAVAGLALAWKNDWLGMQGIVTDAVARIRGALKQLAGIVDALVAGDFATAFQRARQFVQNAIAGIGEWIRSTGVPLLKEAFGILVDRAVEAFQTLQERLPPLLRQAVDAGIQWLQSTGIPLAKQAFVRLVDGAITVFTTLAEKLPPLVDQGIRAGLDWLRTEGVTLAKQAFQLVVDRAVETVRTIATELPPLIQDGVTRMLSWLRENGPGLTKQAFTMLGEAMRFSLENFLATGGILIGLFKDFIGFVATYLREDAVGDLKAAAKFAAEGIVTGVDLAIQAVTPPDGLVVQMIGAVVDYFRNDAADDLKAAAEFLFDVIMAAAEGMYDGLIRNSLIKDMIGDIASYFKNAGKDLIKGAFGTLIQKGLIDPVTGFGDWLINAGGHFFSDTFSAIKTFLTSTGKQKAKAGFDAVVGGIETALGNIDLSDIKNAIQGVIDKASSAIDKVKAIPNNVSTTITRTIKTRTEGAGGGDGVDGPGGATRGFAHGGIVTGPVRALIGEGGDDEAVIPLNRQGEAVLAEAMTEALGQSAPAPRPQAREPAPTRVDASLRIDELAVQVDGSDAGAEEISEAIDKRLDEFVRDRERRLRSAAPSTSLNL